MIRKLTSDDHVHQVKCGLCYSRIEYDLTEDLQYRVDDRGEEKFFITCCFCGSEIDVTEEVFENLNMEKINSYRGLWNGKKRKTSFENLLGL